MLWVIRRKLIKYDLDLLGKIVEDIKVYFVGIGELVFGLVM